MAQKNHKRFGAYSGRIQNMDPGSWTTLWTRSMDHLVDHL